MAELYPCGGILSAYLIGTWDLREKTKSRIQLVNPTAKTLRVMVAFFDDNERPLKCIKGRLSHNDLLEIDVNNCNLDAEFGVIKVVSLNERKDEPEPGVVGYQRHIFTKGVTESILQPIPMEILKDELPIIWRVCRG